MTKRQTMQETLRAMLAGRSIPHFSLQVYGRQIKVVTLRMENAQRWVDLLNKIADCGPIQPTMARERRQVQAVPAFKIIATMKGVKTV